MAGKRDITSAAEPAAIAKPDFPIIFAPRPIAGIAAGQRKMRRSREFA